MILLSLKWHFIRLYKGISYKIIWGNRLKFPLSSNIRNGFHVLIIGKGYLKIGKNCFFNNYCSIVSMSGIEIGEGTIFGESVKIYDHNHCYGDIDIPYNKSGYTIAPIKIGNHCWIGSNVVVLKGVTIGDNSVIGAGCVVYKDVPANTVLINEQNIITI